MRFLYKLNLPVEIVFYIILIALHKNKKILNIKCNREECLLGESEKCELKLLNLIAAYNSYFKLL